MAPGFKPFEGAIIYFVTHTVRYSSIVYFRVSLPVKTQLYFCFISCQLAKSKVIIVPCVISIGCPLYRHCFLHFEFCFLKAEIQGTVKKGSVYQYGACNVNTLGQNLLI